MRFIHIYICTNRERDFRFTYIYIYTCRERERFQPLKLCLRSLLSFPAILLNEGILSAIFQPFWTETSLNMHRMYNVYSVFFPIPYNTYLTYIPLHASFNAILAGQKKPNAGEGEMAKYWTFLGKTWYVELCERERASILKGQTSWIYILRGYSLRNISYLWRNMPFFASW